MKKSVSNGKTKVVIQVWNDKMVKVKERDEVKLLRSHILMFHWWNRSWTGSFSEDLALKAIITERMMSTIQNPMKEEKANLGEKTSLRQLGS
jgi:accessory colonization factor AcfC